MHNIRLKDWSLCKGSTALKRRGNCVELSSALFCWHCSCTYNNALYDFFLSAQILYQQDAPPKKIRRPVSLIVRSSMRWSQPPRLQSNECRGTLRCRWYHRIRLTTQFCRCPNNPFFLDWAPRNRHLCQVLRLANARSLQTNVGTERDATDCNCAMPLP